MIYNVQDLVLCVTCVVRNNALRRSPKEARDHGIAVVGWPAVAGCRGGRSMSCLYVVLGLVNLE
jgi:hypothetical protein